MAVREAFTAEEWQAVGAAPFLVGLYLVGAAPMEPMVIVREMLAAEKAVTLEAHQPDALPIVKEIDADLVAEVLTRDLGVINGAADEQARVLGELARAVALVEAQAPAMDSAFRAWLFRVAEHVARTTAERAPAGAGSRHIGGEVAAALRTLAQMLGVPQR
ncbi:hypothetical protein E3O42_09840 [Cryobacterium adonitolivorans]|uniref:Uncharacterized protein n=1 Tax=Cryobacterium adonitolivorans TaxID=1259189 RepID=A0A4R8W3E1_9MICO|nr:hypothetical protein [Cryobacterium adonitolivorans]TFC01664.1 hypothetical protein E3O42_09840 [Cryobacterium adonitolivorans]